VSRCAPASVALQAALAEPQIPWSPDEAELYLIKRALAHKDGNMSEAAKLLGVDRGKIYRRLAAADERAAGLEG